MPPTLQLPEALDILRRTPEVASHLLAGTVPGWHATDEGPGTWSAFQVIGHLIHTDEAVWPRRAEILLEHGESRPFPPGDPSAHLSRFAGWSIEALLERFAAVREESLRSVDSWDLTDERLRLRGRHALLGTVTLGQLIAAWAVHDLNHLAQISRVMARRYRDEVGAWREVLTILDR